ncbi:MAG: anti-sigma factor [Candidatus Omnitrophota bacterium]
MKECAKVKRILSRYLDKEANSADAAMIEVHINICPSCKKELSGLSQVKGLIVGMERKTVPQDYLVSRLREAIAYVRHAREKLSLAGMGSFARKLIPVPVAAIIVSIAFLMLTSTQAVTESSIEEHIFSGNAATAQTALGLILGSQN